MWAALTSPLKGFDVHFAVGMWIIRYPYRNEFSRKCSRRTLFGIKPRDFDQMSNNSASNPVSISQCLFEHSPYYYIRRSPRVFLIPQ